jgi:hypothetical protein
VFPGQFQGALAQLPAAALVDETGQDQEALLPVQRDLHI